MTVVYPRAMPNCKMQQFQLDIDFFNAATNQQDGNTQVARKAWPRWRLQAQTIGFQQKNFQHRIWRRNWAGFVSSLAGGLRTFLCYDPYKPHPVRYPGGVGLDPTGSAFNITSNSLAISGVTNNMILEMGDHLGLIFGGKYSLHRAVETVQAAGTTISAVDVEPPIDITLFPSGSTVNFVRPVCEMRLEYASDNAPDGLGNPSITFGAIEKAF